MKVVVIDTNIWISGLVFGKQDAVPFLVLQKAAGDDLIATCDELEAEIRQVLIRKFQWTPERAEHALRIMLKQSRRFKLSGAVSVCRDPKDNMFLECSIRAEADLLVTGDKDLLVLKAFHATKIVTPAHYLHEKR